MSEQKIDRPELRILETNPYHDAPDSSAEGIYEAGKEAQLESDRQILALVDREIEEAKKEERDRIIAFMLDDVVRNVGKSLNHRRR